MIHTEPTTAIELTKDEVALLHKGLLLLPMGQVEPLVNKIRKTYQERFQQESQEKEVKRD